MNRLSTGLSGDRSSKNGHPIGHPTMKIGHPRGKACEWLGDRYVPSGDRWVTDIFPIGHPTFGHYINEKPQRVTEGDRFFQLSRVKK